MLQMADIVYDMTRSTGLSHGEILRQLNDLTKFQAKILNKANIGKSSEELIAQWNREHPDDPVED